MKIQILRSSDASHSTAVDEAGNQVDMYLPDTAGGSGVGIRPMQMLIMGLGGCASVDVLTILKKKRQQVRDFSIEIEAVREADKEPALWEKAHLIFRFSGQVEQAKAEKAVEMSMLRYCSVSETLRRAGGALTWEVQTRPD